MITIQNLHFNYGKSAYKVFEDFTLNIPNGKIIGLLGRNGTGKSTLLYLISGLLRPNQGMMLVDGYVSQDRHPEMLQDIMIVPEEIDLPAVSFKDFIRTNRVYYPNFSEEVLHQVLHDLIFPQNLISLRSLWDRKRRCSWLLPSPLALNICSWTNPPMVWTSPPRCNSAEPSLRR